MNRPSIVKFKQIVYPYHIMREWYASYSGILPEDQKKIFLRLKELFPEGASIWESYAGIRIHFFNKEDNDYFTVINSAEGMEF